jgi:hypothetical protein
MQNDSELYARGLALPMLQNWFLTTTMLRHAIRRLRYNVHQTCWIELCRRIYYASTVELYEAILVARIIKETSSAK